MKQFVLAAAALTSAVMAVGPLATAAQAAPQHRETTVVREGRDGRTVVTRRTVSRTDQHRGWRAGDRFDRRQAQNYRVVGDWRAQRLTAPGRGQRWVRSGRDVVLIRDNGTVVRVIQRRF